MAGTSVARLFAIAGWLSFASGAAADVELDGSMGGRSGTLPGPHFVIDASDGKRVNKNLFHSFRNFSIGDNQSATFTGPSGLNNVLSRVTGGNISNIDGLLSSRVPGADFWFINPAGVVFGPNAQIDVPASFHVSTADEILFSDGAVFSASDPSASTLTSAPPEAFGFLGAIPGKIEVQESILKGHPGKTLSLAGGEIDIKGGPEGFIEIEAESGTINLASLAGPGSISADGTKVEGPRGAITLRDLAWINASGNGGGQIRVRAGEFEMTSGSLIQALNNGAKPHEGGIDIEADQVTIKEGSQVDASSFAAGSGGIVQIGASETLSLFGILDANGRISGIFANGSDAGPAGRISVEAPDITMNTGSRMDAGTWSSGNGGTLDIAARNVILAGGARLSSATEGAGNAGQVKIRATGTISMEGKDVLRNPGVDRSGIYASSGWFTSDGTYGDGGTIDIETSTLDVGHAARITANSRRVSGGKAGSIRIDAGRLIVERGGQISNSSASLQTPHDQFQGGDLRINATESITLRGMEEDDPNSFRSGVFSDVQGTGSGNELRLTAPMVTIDGGRVTADAEEMATGAAGSVFVVAPKQLNINNEGQIFTGTNGAGVGGNIDVSAGRIEIIGTGNARTATPDVADQPTGIFTNVKFGGAGPGGTVTVHAADLRLASGGTISAQSNGAGPAGDVRITVSGNLEVNDSAIESAVIRGQGLPPDVSTTGGDILIVADNIRLRNDGTISARSVDSPGAAGRVSLTGRKLELENAHIVTLSSSSSGGKVDVAMGELVALTNSEITTEVQGSADTTAGDIAIDSKFLVLNDSRVVARAFEGQGGNIRIQADNLILSPDSVIDASSARGISGTVVVTAPEIDFSGGLAALPGTFVDPSALIRESCAARRAGGTSSFTRAGRGGLPPGPDGLLPAYYGNAAGLPPSGEISDNGEGADADHAAGMDVPLVADCRETR